MLLLSGMLSDIEKKHSRLMENFSIRAKHLDLEIKRIQATVVVQDTNEEKEADNDKNIFLSEKKTKFIRSHLSKLNTEISDLMKKIKQLQLILNSAT